jgi:integrase
MVPLSDARRIAAKLRAAVAEGRDPAAERKAERGAGTFAELAERYVEEWSRRRNRSWKQADTLVRKYLLSRWSRLDCKSITRADVRAAIGRIKAPMLANQVLAAASAIFAWGVRQEVVSFNPCAGVERHETRSRERVLSDAELPLFWNAFGDAGAYGACLKVLLLLGQRPGECARMRREHIADGWWMLPGAPDLKTGWLGTKNGATHRVWLPKAARCIVEELSQDRGLISGFVFATSRSTPVVNGLDIAMRNICERLNVERVTPHDLRRTHGTRVTALGFGREALNRIQNHREGGIADVYDVHKYAEENQRVMEAVASRILLLAEGQAQDENVVRGRF